MADFETFKAEREKMDPSSRGMSDHQWEQAYAAYKSSRQRGPSSDRRRSSRGSKGHHRRSKSKSSGRGGHTPSSVSRLGRLRAKVREQSAYADLRMLVDLLVWVAVGIVVIAAVFTLMYYTSVPAAIASIFEAMLRILAVLAVRLLAQVLIDIPDIALYRLAMRDEGTHSTDDQEAS